MDDLLMKAKALAALDAGYYPWRSTHNRFRLVDQHAGALVPDVVATTPTEALAAAADALGLSPDPAVVVLTEDEKAIINDALLDYRETALMEADYHKHSYPDIAEDWERTAELADSLRKRLCE